MNRKLFSVIAYLGMALLMFGCSTELASKKLQRVGTYSVGLVFNGFYDQDVRLLINGTEVLNAKLSVDDDHTNSGLNLVLQYDILRDNIFHLITKDLDVEVEVIAGPKTRYIYINPFYPPYILSSDHDGILLD